jgi:hypothetical protein
MSEIAESIIDGSVCSDCGHCFGDSVGFARLCATCGDIDPNEESKARRAANRENSNRILRENGYDLEERNDGAHLIVSTAAGLIDFWPGTGKFIVRATRYEARGVFPLMKHAAPKQQELAAIQWAPHMTPFAIKTYIDAGFTVVGAPEESR